MERTLLVAAWLAALTANLIHNRFGLDPAIAPATILTGLYLWRRNRWLLWAAALMIALPSFLFFRLSALGSPGAIRPFVNHLALLLAGLTAVLAVLASVRSGPRGAPAPQGT